jgi:acyl-CoA reductase-like NAD-dependent aldehyde dehydrogenase
MEKLIIKNPANGAVLAELDSDTPESIHNKYLAAKKAQIEWVTVSYSEKSKIVAKFNELLKSDIDECSAIMMRETGKPIQLSKNELNATPERIQFFIDHCEKRMALVNAFSGGNMTEQISFEPLGVVGNISAWNYPYFVGTNVFIPGLLTGNAVLYKPSEFATLTGQKMVELMEQAGLPKNLFTCIIGGGEAGAALVEEKIDGLFFTGSYNTGKKIASAMAGRMAKVQLELGGKDPVYICDDMDPIKAAESVMDGACYNAGQSCCGLERVYVHEKIYDKFLEHLISNTKSIKIGDPEDSDTYLGPMTQPQHLEVLESQIEDALSKGARVLLGGKRLKGRTGYFEPTVLSKVTHDMDVMKNETFGPIIPVMSVENDEMAIQLMNDTVYGLTSAVFTYDQNRAKKIMSSIDSGTVYWNCCDRVSPNLPWSGRGHSGMGWTLADMGIDIFLKPKAWHLRSLEK